MRALLTVATAILLSASLSAQARDGFARAVVDAVNADQAPAENRRAAMAAARAAMVAALKEWDAAVARVEAGFAAGIKVAPPEQASRMRMALGAVYLERGRFEAAAAQFAQAAALNQSAAEPHAFRGMALEQGLRRGDAAEAYRQAWRRDTANAVYAYRFLRASRGQPDTADTSGARASLLRALEEPGASMFELLTVQLLDADPAAGPMLPVAAHAAAFEAIQQGRYDEGVTGLRVPAENGAPDVRVTPQSVAAGGPLPLVGGAALLGRIGRDAHVRLDLDAAVAAYERRVTLLPNHSGAHYDLAEVYRARDDGDAAMVEAAAAALLDRSAAKPLVLIGQLHAAAGRDEEAGRALQRAVTLAPDDPEARYALSRALLRTGRAAEAQRELDVFRQLQAKAMAEQRQQFEDNFRKIEETLKTTEPSGDRR